MPLLPTGPFCTTKALPDFPGGADRGTRGARGALASGFPVVVCHVFVSGFLFVDFVVCLSIFGGLCWLLGFAC